MSTTNSIPVYVLQPSTPEEESQLDNQIHAEVEGPIARKPSDTTTIQTAREAIAHAAGLDSEQWYTKYVIIIDQPADGIQDHGVLVVNMDFQGRLDGIHPPIHPSIIYI